MEKSQQIDIGNSQPFVRTSLKEVTHTLPVKPPCRIFFKNEYEQPCGSFKLRGIGNLIYKQIQKARRAHSMANIHVYASSGGNAGLAAAYLARFFKVKCTVVLPTISKPEIRARLQEYGAAIILRGSNINEADQYLRDLIIGLDDSIVPIYCHPFDNPVIWEGHASMMDEVAMQLPYKEFRKVKGVVCSVGGGGLYNGAIKGLTRNLFNDTGVVLVETSQAPTFTETIKAGRVITLNSVNSLATSLACSYLSNQCLENYHNSKYKTYVETMDDLDAVRGSVDLFNNTGLVVEPACGAAVSLAYEKMHMITKNLGNLKPDDIVVIVVCGGSCTNLEGIENFKKLLNDRCKL